MSREASNTGGASYTTVSPFLSATFLYTPSFIFPLPSPSSMMESSLQCSDPQSPISLEECQSCFGRLLSSSLLRFRLLLRSEVGELAPAGCVWDRMVMRWNRCRGLYNHISVGCLVHSLVLWAMALDLVVVVRQLGSEVEEHVQSGALWM